MIFRDQCAVGRDEMGLSAEPKHVEQPFDRDALLYLMDLSFPFDYHGKFITQARRVVKGGKGVL
jgi:hypothetical protein